MRFHRIFILSCFSLAFLVIILSLLVFFSRQQQKIEQYAAGTTTIGQYEKFELTYPYSGNYSNPNDPGIVDVEAVFTSPSGKIQTVPGFYFQDYTRSGNIQKQTLTPTGTPVWKVRYAPQELGNYMYTVTLKDASGTKTLGSGSFSAVSSNNPGFVRASGLTLLRDKGAPFFMLGVNAPGWQPFTTWQGHPWKWGDGTYGVDNLYQQMNANGLNWYHMWTCQSFATPNIGCPQQGGDPTQMSQPDSWEIDYAINQAEIHDIYTTIVLHWNSKTYDPYDPIKARYFVARWGYSTHIVAWDYQKEISTDPAATSAWSSYVKSVDPYNHLRTTTQWNHYAILGPGNLNIFNAVFNDPNMTMVQSHDYFSDCNDTLTSDTSLYYFSIYSDSDPRSSRRFNKPNFNGEGGLGANTNCQNEGGGGGENPLVLTDHAGVILKGYVWGTFMSTLAGTSPWWYYTEPQAGWTQFTGFKALRAYAGSLPIVPDSAATFTSYNDTSQATTSTPMLRVIGRKNTNFAMAYIQNTTGTWSSIVRDNKTPTPTGGTITLKNMVGNFTVNWFDVDGNTGNIIKTETVSANSGSLSLNLPTQIAQSIAVVVTTGNSPTSTPSPTLSTNSVHFSLTLCPHGLGNCGDNVNPQGGGNTNPLHVSRNVTVTVLDNSATPIASQQAVVSYNQSSQNFQGTVAIPNVSPGTYLIKVKMDEFLSKQIPGTFTISQGQPITLPLVSLITGDINNDDQLDILDYNILVSCFGSKQNTSSCTNPPTSQSPGADITDDGTVDGVDYNLLLRELSVQHGG